MIQIVVLGSAAGGGFPQWNSNAPGCRRARAHDPAALPRTQASLAISADGRNWFLLNASPDLRAQINATPELHPNGTLRSSPIQGVLLTGGEVDTITGLLTLRERQPLGLYATRPTLDLLDANPIFEVLNREVVTRNTLTLNHPIPLPLTDGQTSGLTATAFAVPGKAPLYAENAANPTAQGEDGETIGLDITDGTHHLLYIPGCAIMTDALIARAHQADALFFDATLWHDAEMIEAGLGQKTGRRMGHMSVSGPGGVLDTFKTHRTPRKILIHINNSNPILLADSPESAQVEAAGWQVAEDGLRLTL